MNYTPLRRGGPLVTDRPTKGTTGGEKSEADGEERRMGWFLGGGDGVLNKEVRRSGKQPEGARRKSRGGEKSPLPSGGCWKKGKKKKEMPTPSSSYIQQASTDKRPTKTGPG